MRKIVVHGFMIFSLALTLFAVGCGSSSSSTPVDTTTPDTTTPDTTAPTVAKCTPDDAETGVALDAMVSVNFDESIDPTTVDGATLALLADGATDPVMGTVSYDNGTFKVVCDPNYQLTADTLYTATLTATVCDIAGNMMAEGLTWSFRTAAADLAPPDVAEVFPADGSTDASAVTELTVTYSEILNAAPTDGAMTLTCGGLDVTGIANYAGLTQAVFTPDAMLTIGDTCTATFSSTLEDAAANSGLASATWSFTVDVPRITGTPYAAGPVDASTPIEITVPVNAAADCVTVGLLDDTGTSVATGANCAATPGDTEIVVSISTTAGPGGDYLIAVSADHNNGPPTSTYDLDDTISTDNYTLNSYNIGPKDSGIPLGYATLVPMPDLTIEVLAAEDFGNITQVWFEACNNGFADADPFEVSVFIDPATTPQVGDPADGYGGIYGLPMGWCEVDSIFAQGNPGLSTNIWATVDSAQDVTESDESNNRDQFTWVRTQADLGNSTEFVSTDVPKSVTYNAYQTSTLPISLPTTSLDDLVVTVNITHSHNHDLDISLTSPSGTIIDLSSDNGPGGGGYIMTSFDDTASRAVASYASTYFYTFSGSYRPEQPLSTFAGENPNGTWTLTVNDDYFADSGNLTYFSIDIW